MSTNSECDFIEIRPGVWYYVLEDGDAPKNSWDWREHATAYGPFSTFNQARRHLADHHPNPGGYSVLRHAANPCTHPHAELDWSKRYYECLTCAAYRRLDGNWPEVNPDYVQELDPVLEGLIQKAPENTIWRRTW